MPTFIETQFSIARLSAESYKERKANNGQTLTRLGKWWGRKPLILVRASKEGVGTPFRYLDLHTSDSILRKNSCPDKPE
ncbi:MAG: DUF1156 domain-containing protein [Pseudomonadota bacterium]